MKKILLTILILLLISCSDDKITDPINYADISGQWDGNTDLSFMSLVQNGESITGEVCEAENHDCMQIQGGSYKDGILQFYYQFNEGNTTFNGHFEISSNGTQLTGTLSNQNTNQSFSAVFTKR